MQADHQRPEFRVCVVGGGASGMLTAISLLNASTDTPLAITIVDARDRLGGVAYTTTDTQHLLNVPCIAMSAFGDDPEHLLRWARSAGIDASASTFIPRKSYGRYLNAVLEEAVVIGKQRGHSLSMIRAQAVACGHDADTGGYVVSLSDDNELHTNAVVLACGPIYVGVDTWLDDGPNTFHSAWCAGALRSGLGESEPESVAIIGAGLTAVDAAISLAKNCPETHITMISRTGQLPMWHRSNPIRDKIAPPQLDLGSLTIEQLVAALTSLARTQRENGGDWRDVVDSIRPTTHAIWQALSDDDKRTFMKHHIRTWEIHRHRMAHSIRERLNELTSGGRLSVVASRVTAVTDHKTHVDIQLQPRDGEPNTLQVSRVIDCTNAPGSASQTANPLIRSMLDSGLISVDPLDISLHTHRSPRVLSTTGESASIFTLGPPRKGELWETLAVPEIRTQAAEIASAITADAARALERSTILRSS